ncbi:cell wall metabolism sensor histidine kinase WalK [Saccharopolyspora sp. 6M]|uniref:sensor histidine kinase n=1 Tax=Saccharopolyspora sp. 6M TaxID=2877237 RepID=UPI001CD25804|nr:HAMP domain-containing sensor histidine kinase [Saccharopolyspora sp. 6M]MCA1225225.1 HAMP domain-containing histidine kinase [Saccharopolyspora sp. 6M]
MNWSTLRRLRTWWSRRTLRFRTSAVATAVALVGFGVLAHFGVGLMSWLLVESVDAELNGKVEVAARQVATGTPPREVAGGEVRVLDTSGVPVDSLPDPRLGRSNISELKSGEGVVEWSADGPARGLYRWVGTVVPDPAGDPRLVLGGAHLIGHSDTVRSAGRALALGSIIAAGAVGVATWLVVRRSLRPVERMRVAAVRLPEGRRLPVPAADDELRALAEALNEMLARRDGDTEWLRRFTGDAAHELRNPVASIRAQAEVAVVHPDPELAQETLQDIAAEAQRMSELVDGLLALARAESGSQPPQQPIELGSAVRAAADRANLRGGRPRVQVTAPTGSVVILAGAAEVATVLDNVIGNALRHARALVRVSLLPAAESVRLVVDDDGPGIPAEHRTRVFDRFHRVQPDRARRTGGAGLGLALVAEAVRGRGGSVHAAESPEGGARIEIRWPLPGPLRPAPRGG